MIYKRVSGCSYQLSGDNKESYGGEADIAPVAEEDFPSLKEAAMMAKGIKMNKLAKNKESSQKDKGRTAKITEDEADLDDINWNEDIGNQSVIMK